MKPTKIAFTKKYFPEQYHGEDYFIEYDLEEGDTLCACFKKAKEDTFECFRNNNPQLQWNDEVIQTKEVSFDLRHNDIVLPKNGTAPPLKLASQEKLKTGTIEEQIRAYPIATVETILKEIDKFSLSAKIFKSVYAMQVEGNPELKKAYDKKLKELELNNKSIV